MFVRSVFFFHVLVGLLLSAKCGRNILFVRAASILENQEKSGTLKVVRENLDKSGKIPCDPNNFQNAIFF